MLFGYRCVEGCKSCIQTPPPLCVVDGIVSYFKKQAGPASVVLRDDGDLQTFISDEDASIVGELALRS